MQYALVAKINDSGAAVKASVDPVTFGLNLQTTDSRQLWLQDVDGNVLNELGIIKDSSQLPPYNIGDSVRVSGGSLFDSVIALRDAMLTGDQDAIGGRVLGSIDNSVNNLVTRLAESGAQYERAVNNIERNSLTALNVTSMISREGDLDRRERRKARGAGEASSVRTQPSRPSAVSSVPIGPIPGLYTL